MLESLMGVAERTRARKLLPGPRDPAMRKARVCYDHLAGDLAVRACDILVERNFIRISRTADDADTLTLTQSGRNFFASRRPLCRPCLDWSVRRQHLAGRLGKALARLSFRQTMGQEG